MKKFLLILLISFCSCNSNRNEPLPDPVPDAVEAEDTVVKIEPDQIEPAQQQPMSNERFRNVRATKLTDDSFRIEGEAQVFEAAFSWVVEDGHNELAQGHAMTDAGAPEWGKFSFVVNVEKDRSNSTLNLIIYEASAKDGSRQHELFYPLY